MFELSKMFLLCLNYWKLETPTQYRQRSQKDDGTAYKVDYTRFAHTTHPSTHARRHTHKGDTFNGKLPFWPFQLANHERLQVICTKLNIRFFSFFFNTC